MVRYEECRHPMFPGWQRRTFCEERSPPLAGFIGRNVAVHLLMHTLAILTPLVVIGAGFVGFIVKAGEQFVCLLFAERLPLPLLSAMNHSFNQAIRHGFHSRSCSRLH